VDFEKVFDLIRHLSAALRGLDKLQCPVFQPVARNADNLSVWCIGAIQRPDPQDFVTAIGQQGITRFFVRPFSQKPPLRTACARQS
jgi:hypothetical protein